MAKLETATFGAGCFWHTEEAFRVLDGVEDTAVGFMGGIVENPSYEDVSHKETGHVEVAQVTFDSSKISYDELVTAYWDAHDPTQVNRQGSDVGKQYRSVIFYHSDEQKKVAEASKKELEDSGKYKKSIVTTIEPATDFYKAEDYHQKYLAKRGLSSCPI